SNFDVSFIKYIQRKPVEWFGNPFIVEGVLAVSADFAKADTPTLYRFANRVPLLYDSSDDILTRLLRKMNWVRYGIKSVPPVAVFLHVCSTRIPYKAAGKQSLGSSPEIEAEVIPLLRGLGRSLEKVTKRSDRATKDAKKRREFEKGIQLVAKFSAELANTKSIPPTDALIQNFFEVDSNA
ncbi:MAG: hypothetical protein RTV31_17230, partial [Candidatus Thorarchaeota archaeon]